MESRRLPRSLDGTTPGRDLAARDAPGGGQNDNERDKETEEHHGTRSGHLAQREGRKRRRDAVTEERDEKSRH